MVLANIIEIAVSNEYTLNRWRKVVSVLMEKIAGSPVIHKFRTIHLIESDLNFVMRLVWGRNFMRHNEKNKSWHPNQYGGRKGHQGQSAALNKILTMDIIRHYAEPAALIDNDAQACYDRLIPVVLSYSLIRLGLPIHLTRFMCRWLERAEYFLKLGKGVSKHAYKNTLETYLYGSGQGTGWSPPNWGSISDILSTAMSENSPGMYLSHPNNKVFSNRSYDAFVDDVNGGVTSEGMQAYHPDSELSVPIMDTIFEQIEVNVEYYSRLLFSSGGRLALHKCYCYILEFEWKNGVKKLSKTANKYEPLQIDQQSNNTKVPIKLLNPHQARKMLGSISAPDGSSTEQVQTLIEKAKKWGDKVHHGYLNRYDLSVSMRQGLIKSLEYPLGVSLISEKECDSIMIPAMSPFLRKLGFNKNTSRNVVYGPHCYGGLQLPNLYTTQGIQKLQLFLGHSRKKDPTCTILTIALACAQQEVGISQPILMSSMSKWGHLLSQCWIKCLWKFLSTISGKIRQTNVWTPPKCYEHDVNIMEQVKKWGISMEEEKNINLCRIYMKVSFIGELYDTSRVRIKTNVTKFVPGFHNNRYPNVQLPKSYQEIWQNALHRLKQETPLGDRLGNVTSTDSFEWRTSSNHEYLFRYSSNRHIGTYKRMHQSTSSLVFSENVCQVKSPPPPTYVVTIRKLGDLFHASHPLSIPIPKVPKPFQSPGEDKIQQFYSKLQSKEAVYIRTVGKIHEIGNLQAIATAIRNSKALGVGDASVARDLGGHAYVIETQPAKHRIHGTAPVDCLVEDLTSNRGESSTVLAMLIVTSIVCDIFHIKEGSISIMCDNKEALRRRKIATCTYTNLATRDMDIKMEVEHLLSILPIKVDFHHVPGHADDDPNFDYDRAPQRIQRNVDMHYSVTSFMKYPASKWAPTNITPFFPRQQAALLINDYVISGDIKNHVMMQKHGFPMESRLQEKFKVENRFLHIIDWRSFKLAYSGLDLSYKTSATKIIHKLWPTSSSAMINTDGKSPMCMRCSLAPETVDHVYRCTHRQAQSSFREAILAFKKDLKRIKTAIPLQNMFVEFFLAFRDNRQPSLIPHTFGDKKKHDLIRRAYDHQLLLGKNIFHLGYISYKWGIVFKAYSTNEKKGTHHISWASKVIKAIWNFSQRIWRQRCSWIHQKQSGIDESLYTEELKSTIKEYLKLPRNLLSKRERALHINVSRHLRVAYSTTLARWLRLLANERAETIRSKRKDRIAKGGLQPLTKFFRWRTSVKEGNF